MNIFANRSYRSARTTVRYAIGLYLKSRWLFQRMHRTDGSVLRLDRPKETQRGMSEKRRKVGWLVGSVPAFRNSGIESPMRGKRGTRAWMRKINSADVTSWIGTRVSRGSLPRNLDVSVRWKVHLFSNDECSLKTRFAERPTNGNQKRRIGVVYPYDDLSGEK